MDQFSGSRSHVTSSVSSISIITRDTSEQEIELDPEMVFESRQIPLFPTLKSTQGLNELRAMISEYDQRQHAIVIAELRKFQSIAGAGSTPGDLKAAWTDLGATTQAMAMTYATEAFSKDTMAARLLDIVIQSPGELDDNEVGMQLAAGAVEEFKEIIVAIDISPTQELSRTF